MSESSFGLFDVYGIEMEYMLVDRETLNVRPVADKVLAALAGKTTCEVEIGPITWSNELALHVLELKTTDPVSKLRRLPTVFEKAISDLEPTLESLGVQLLPTAVHPWMNPNEETRLWPHEYHEIYETYDRIFDCRSHGWANVQSVHLNLPFSGDEEFARLHAATRLLLPLLPALAASSPVLNGRYSGLLDTRMMLYGEHCRMMRSLAGDLIPEPIYDEATYREQVLDRIAYHIAPHDPEQIMQVEFLNARGAIARFDRGSIELRVMDVQEYPGADVAICAAVSALARALCNEKWSSLEEQKKMPTIDLRWVLDATMSQAENAVIQDAELLSHFGVRAKSISARNLWFQLLQELRKDDTTLDNLFAPLTIILEKGTLASRISTALGRQFTRDGLANVYREVADSLTTWEPFQP